MSKEIQLSKGNITIVDDDDFEWVSKNKWCIDGRGYAVRRKPFSKGGKIILHREIMKTEKGMEVDHVNGNRLDNRKENLRNVHHFQNGKNLSIKSNNKTGYAGVSLDKRCGKYKTQIQVNGKFIFLGYYTDIEEAANAYKVGSKKHFKEFSRI